MATVGEGPETVLEADQDAALAARSAITAPRRVKRR